MTATAAERARRYRARRAERDAGVTSRDAELVAVLGEILEAIHALRRDINAVDNVTSRGRHALERDVTERHADEGAPAPARVRARLSSPTGSREPYVNQRDVTATPIGFVDLGETATPTLVDNTRRILETLRTAPAPPSAPALADALDLPAGAVLGVLVALTRAGLVRRIAGTSARERDRWAATPPAESLGETISCSDYRAHQLTGHRRDPATGHFRCYACEPEELVASM